MKKIGQIKISHGLWRYSLKRIRHFLQVSYIKNRASNPKTIKVFVSKNKDKDKTWQNYTGFKIIAQAESKTLHFYQDKELSTEDLKILAFFIETPLYLDNKSGGVITLNNTIFKVGFKHPLYSKMLKKITKALK